MQVIRRTEIELAASAFFRAKGNDVVIGEAQEFRDMAPHHCAAVRSGQGSNEQTVITSRHCTSDRPRGEPAESVCHQPFARKKQLA